MSSGKELEEFQEGMSRNIAALGNDVELRDLSLLWNIKSSRHKYTYHFTSMGRPIIQFPQDMIAMQELIWQVKPDLVIEAGIAHGGSLVMSAAMLALLDYCDAVESGQVLDPRKTRRRVLGIDIQIRQHNRIAIEAHPLSHRIDMIEGSSIAAETIAKVHAVARDHERVLVCLDSNHVHAHVLAELEAYAPLTSKQSYCVVFDTIVEDLPADMFPERPWGKGNSPKTAVFEYLRRIHTEGRRASDGESLAFEIDRTMENKLLITVAPDGYLKRI